jgi:cytosylglucuronate decarboxylase
MKEFETPIVLFIKATEACNANCFMCDFAKKNTPYYLTENVAELILEKLLDSSIKHIRITGGEPLLSNDIANIISIFKSKKLAVSIITNGLLLKKRSESLVKSGIDQIIVSLDSSKSQLHNKLRNTNGLFENAIDGIKSIYKTKPFILLRINTVLSNFNIEELPEMFKFLNKLNIQQWSLIPLKPLPNADAVSKSLWLDTRMQLFELQQKLEFPKLMGYSLDAFGKNEIEFDNIFKDNRPQTPKQYCNTIYTVSFLDLGTSEIFPCNCIPHRKEYSKQFSSETDNFIFDFPEDKKHWLYENAPKVCSGCEPLNAALGDGKIDLENNIFDF